MLDVSANASERLSHLLNQGVKLPPLPASGLELMNILRQPIDVLNVNHIAGIVENDPTLAANLLRVANSPMYGSARAVTRVHQAIVVMGLDETVQMLNYYLMRKLFPKIPEFEFFSAEKFWQHAWGCATAARLMGQPQYLVGCLPGELYLAGLLHDIGKIVFSIYLSGDFDRCLREAAATGRPLHKVEQEIIGLDHALVGAKLLDAWNLPAPILAAVGSHHAPERLKDEWREIAGLIELANMLAYTADIGGSGNPRPLLLDETWIARKTKSPLVMGGEKSGILHEIKAQLKAKAEAWKKKDEKSEENQAEQATAAGASIAVSGMNTMISKAQPATPQMQKSGGLLGWFKRLMQ